MMSNNVETITKEEYLELIECMSPEMKTIINKIENGEFIPSFAETDKVLVEATKRTLRYLNKL